ncbi:MAG: transcriptional repressor [Bacilli bacterium]|nr:transcriptional repressor [Bacilli bacterium]
MQIKGYHTKQKNIIIEMLKNNKNRHLTADEMLKILDELNSPVSKATLYRFLDVLVSTGDLRKYITLDGEKACYQYVDEDECHMHYHLKCIECGTLIHMDCKHIDEIRSHVLKEHKFNVDPCRIVLYGTCSKCMEVQNEKNS